MRISLLAVLLCSLAAAAPERVLIIDGQNNHEWQVTTPLLKKALENTKLFRVDVATSPAKGADMTAFHPDLKQYAVIVSNYSDYGGGGVWSTALQKDCEAYVNNGGGFVTVHAADNAFPQCKEFNLMIGVGGWQGRTEKDGPMLRWRDGKIVRDMTPGKGGHHGRRHEDAATTHVKNHPIKKGLPDAWLHTEDELYDALRSPAENVTVLATAFADKATGGTGEHEPALMTIAYGKGRVFHTILCHHALAMQCVGFITTFQRGTEWAATGKVTQKAPADFPSPTQVSLRK